MSLPDGKDMPYWKTGRSDPGTVIDKAVEEVRRCGGRVFSFGRAFDEDGNSAYMIDFTADGEQFKIMWPVLPHDERDEKAASRQAASMLLHDIKSRAVRARVFGMRAAFMESMLLPGGKTVAQHSTFQLETIDWARTALPAHGEE